MSRRTPLYDVHRRLGATFTEFAGWSMPVRYTSELAEHHAVRRAAGLFDLSHMAEIEISGPEVARFLDHALVGKLSAIGVGRAKYTMLCHPTGGVLDDVVVYRLEDERYLLVANAANASLVCSQLIDRANGFVVAVENVTDQWALVAVQGPRAAEIVALAVDVDVNAFKYYAIDAARLAGHDVLLARTGYTGEDGFEIYSSASDAVDVWETLSDLGAPHSLRPAGLASRDTLRLEAGMPLYGQELTVHRTPLEAGLGRVIAFDKRAFVGKAALVERRESGLDHALVGLRSKGRRAPRHGYRVVDPQTGEQVGVVTSGALSPTLGYPVAMAYVSADRAEPGTGLAVDVRGASEAVEVVTLPFYRRDI